MMRTLQPWYVNIQKRQVKQPKAYFRDSGIFHTLHSGAEIDLLIHTPDGLQAFEFEFSSQPKITSSMKEAFSSLGLKKITVVVPGTVQYPLSEVVEVKGLNLFGSHHEIGN